MTEEDVEILVDFVAVTDVVIRDEVAFSVVKSIFVADDASSSFLLFQKIR